MVKIKKLGYEMSEAQILQRIASDLDFLKTKIISIEETIEDIDNDLHHVKPEYIRKLESIKKEGTISSSDFEKKFGVRLWNIITKSAGSLKENWINTGEKTKSNSKLFWKRWAKFLKILIITNRSSVIWKDCEEFILINPLSLFSRLLKPKTKWSLWILTTMTIYIKFDFLVLKNILCELINKNSLSQLHPQIKYPFIQKHPFMPINLLLESIMPTIVPFLHSNVFIFVLSYLFP